MMPEWFCTNCECVFMAGEAYAKCCGQVEKFNPCDHGRKLVGKSNSWIQVWNTWKDHPLLDEAAQEVYETGNSGASMILNAFIELLLERIDLDSYI